MDDPAWPNLLQALAGLDTVDRISSFNVVPTSYKQLTGGAKIHADILLPKAAVESQKPLKGLPVIVRIHGGYLVGGSSLYLPWLSDWVIELALQEKAIIVSPNYRLLPESKGSDILDDMDDFWKWLSGGGIESALQLGGYGTITTDLTSTLVLGESAGGYLAIYLALTYPKQISALIGAYPMVDVEASFYNLAFDKSIVGVPTIDPTLLQNHLQAMDKSCSNPPTAACPPDRLALSFSVVQSGRYLEFLGCADPRLFPLRRLDDPVDADGRDGGANLPQIFFLHGEDDSAVPKDGTVRLVSKLKETRPNARVAFTLRPGDHGFDADATLRTPWLQEGIDGIRKAWLK